MDAKVIYCVASFKLRWTYALTIRLSLPVINWYRGRRCPIWYSYTSALSPVRPNIPPKERIAHFMFQCTVYDNLISFSMLPMLCPPRFSISARFLACLEYCSFIYWHVSYGYLVQNTTLARWLGEFSIEPSMDQILFAVALGRHPMGDQQSRTVCQSTSLRIIWPSLW